jgi:serine protease AprX
MRILQYADLSDQGEQIGSESPSLWDSEGDSWHGQMTLAIAAGNGLLSNGRFRGFAHRARLLPIKIGREGGRIPEDDILRGLQWLLRDDNWLRYDVRVLNLSVGGDHAHPWRQNPVCLAAQALSERGVFVVAAAGNSQSDYLLAPAQTPSVLTVGGVDDANLPWHISYQNNLKQVSLYEHNWCNIEDGTEIIHKPELLALGKWLPSPILPATPVFKEMHAISSLRSTIYGKPSQRQDVLLEHWHRTLHMDPLYTRDHPGQSRDEWLLEIEHALRRRMNAHKWVHAYYQHVDGTSVAAAQVSAVAAQMIQANPGLTPAQTKALLMHTALPLSHLPSQRSGKGLLQPAAAVAAALRAPGGVLAGEPNSATSHQHHRGRACTKLDDSIWDELRRQGFEGTVPTTEVSAPPEMFSVHFGVFAPRAWTVSLIGTFNKWMPDRLPLQRGRNGWWHLNYPLARGVHLYRFWIVDAQHPTGDWHQDPENPCRVESGYDQCHSAIFIRVD